MAYSDFPSHFTWKKEKKWGERERGDAIGRMYFVSPLAGERYFLRTLLTVVKGATSFEDLRTVDGHLHDTFKGACVALGLYDTDEEWNECLVEAAIMQTGTQLRSLFVIILIHGCPADPRGLWNTHHEILSDDCERQLQHRGIQRPSEEQVLSLALCLISKELAKFDKMLADFDLPLPQIDFEQLQANQLILEQRDSDVIKLRQDVQQGVQNLNDDQRIAYNAIIGACSTENPKVFFIDGPGGTGKTYLENLILKTLRGDNKIALAVASSGIAALLLDKGRTTHSMLKIPITPHKTSVCSIQKQSDLAKLIRETKLIIWDEAPMMGKLCFEAVDRSLRDITERNIPFGGITFVMCGDFRQVLPVIPKGTRPQIVSSSVKESSLWRHVKVYQLRINMRIAAMGDGAFGKWLIDLGEGKLPTVDGEYVTCPSNMLLPQQNMSKLIEAIYSEVRNRQEDDGKYLSERAILSPRNDEVREINSQILGLVWGESHDFLSADKLEDPEGAEAVSSEYMNAMEVGGFPSHKLTLKVGVPIMLLRNLDAANGLCNGTRLIVLRHSSRVIETKVLTGDHAGHIAFIPRITLIAKPEQSGLPYMLYRKQFPLPEAYAMTINKSQGQTLKYVGINLTKEVFSHGQLYVAFSHAISSENVAVLLGDGPHAQAKLMRNVVYNEAL